MSVLRNVIPRWPLMLLIALAAVGASAIALSQREPSYTATATLLITPVAQYDETFLGTSLVRDPGDANRTAPTAAELLDSNEVAVATARRFAGGWTADAVRDAVDVKPVANTNLITITAKATERSAAEQIAAVFARSALRVRWRIIARELDERIAALAARPAGRGGGELGREIRILQAARRSGRDPTLRLLELRPAVADSQVPTLVVLVLALLGGLFLGGLTAAGVGRIQRRLYGEGDVVSGDSRPELAPLPPPGGDAFRSVAAQIEHWAPDGGTVAVTSPSNGDGRAAVTAEIAAAITESGRTAAIVTVTPFHAQANPIQKRLSDARSLADFVLADSPPLDDDSLGLKTAALADVLVLVVLVEKTAQEELQRVRNLLERNSIRPAGLVLVHPTDGSSPEPPAPGGAMNRTGLVRSSRAVEPPGDSQPHARRQRLMGMPLDGVTIKQAVERVLAGLADGRGGAVLTPNIDILRRYRQSPTLQRIFETTELLVPDGMPLVWASRLQGTPVPQRVTGTDMLWALSAAAAERGATVFLAGGRPGVARRAADRLVSAYPGLRVRAHPCYVMPGPLADQLDDLTEALMEAQPDLVYLGLPFDSQVQAISMLRLRLPKTWFVGIGSCFDLINGDRPRAPEWLQRLGLEWAHRVVHEPRVWRRYVVHGLPVAGQLGVDAFKERMRKKRLPAAAVTPRTEHVSKP